MRRRAAAVGGCDKRGGGGGGWGSNAEAEMVCGALEYTLIGELGEASKICEVVRKLGSSMAKRMTPEELASAKTCWLLCVPSIT